MDASWTLALGMMLLLEGIIPFLLPRQWRKTFSQLLRLSDGQIRFLGLFALLGGVFIIGLARLSN